MPAPSLVSVTRRSLLPATCLALSVLAAVAGEYVLADLAGSPTLGGLTARTVALLAAAAFGVLFLLTTAMTFLSKDTPVTTEPTLHDLDEDLARALDELESQPATGRRRGKHAAEVPTEAAAESERLADIITALKRAAATSAEGKAAAEAQLGQVRAELAEAHARLAAAPEAGGISQADIAALTAQIREEVQREALAQVQDLNDRSERLTTSLKDALARAEAQAEQTRTQAADERADLIAAHVSEVAAVREQATAAEYERIKIALLAVNRTHTDVLDPMQREAVERHQQRIIDAFAALDAEHRNVVLPQVPMPRLSAPAPTADVAVGVEAEDSEEQTAGRKRGRLRLRR